MDSRVSAARVDQSEPLAVLLTYVAEMRSATHVECQRIIAVLLPEGGDAVEVSPPECWLHMAEGRQPSMLQPWHQLFANWVPKRQIVAEAVAAAAMRRDTEQFSIDHRHRADREAVDLARWLCGRADHICGAFVPRTGDLFGAGSPGADWQMLSEPIDRLAAFAADGGNPPARRREANSAVELFQRRCTECEGRTTLSPPFLRLIGMLMLVPVDADG